MLKRYWFRTDPPLGYGVTAESRAAAERLLQEYGYPLSEQRVVEILEDVEVTSLDPDHVLPNSGPLVVRGIWYPRHNL